MSTIDADLRDRGDQRGRPKRGSAPFQPAHDSVLGARIEDARHDAAGRRWDGAWKELADIVRQCGPRMRGKRKEALQPIDKPGALRLVQQASSRHCALRCCPAIDPLTDRILTSPPA